MPEGAGHSQQRGELRPQLRPQDDAEQREASKRQVEGQGRRAGGELEAR